MVIVEIILSKKTEIHFNENIPISALKNTLVINDVPSENF